MFFFHLFFAGDTAKIIFSIGNKIFETNKNGENLRTLYESFDQDITSFDYNAKTNKFYFADDKNNKVFQQAVNVNTSTRTLKIMYLPSKTK